MFPLRKSIEIGKCLISSASGIWMKPKGQVSKFTCTNTVTSSRTQVKSHKVFQKDSPEVVSEKSWFEKFHKKFTQRNYHEFLSSVTSQLTTSLKRTPSQLSSDEFWRFFRMLFYVITLAKQQKELKYSSAYVLVKADLKNFTKFIQKKLWWSSF